MFTAELATLEVNFVNWPGHDSPQFTPIHRRFRLATWENCGAPAGSPPVLQVMVFVSQSQTSSPLGGESMLSPTYRPPRSMRGSLTPLLVYVFRVPVPGS